MANFRTHITTSSLLGCGYGAWGAWHGMPLETCFVATGLCGLAGMLPDIDSDSGVPLRETLSAAAAIVPMLLVDRLQSMGLSYDAMVLTGGLFYFLVRIGLGKIISHYTVHRGMFHSLPAAATFSGLAYLLCGCADERLRYFKAGGVLVGVLSHLLLDEIYSIEWKHGRWNFKNSFGTAFKLWGDDPWANFSAYTKLLLIGGMIASEPAVMQRLNSQNPALAGQLEKYQRGIQSIEQKLQTAGQNLLNPTTPNYPGLAQQPVYPQQPRYPAPVQNQPSNGYYPNSSDPRMYQNGGAPGFPSYSPSPAPLPGQYQPANQNQIPVDTARRWGTNG